MSINNDKFERLQNYLWACNCDFCIVYQASEVGVVKHGKKREPIIELIWHGVFSAEIGLPGKMTNWERYTTKLLCIATSTIEI